MHNIEKVLCIKREHIPASYLHECTAQPLTEHTLRAWLGNCPFEFRSRNIVEADSAYKQIIPYVLVFNELKQLLIHSRQGGESRLHGLWSLGVGGHVNHEDAVEPSLFTCILHGTQRECREEISATCENFQLLGIINEEKTAVGKTHLGIVFKICLPTCSVKKTQELANSRFISLTDCDKFRFELWSELALLLLSQSDIC
ncbi:MAG: NUDIX domain-containing protein [Oligosphaeraceae bacterium]|nr:NUDIX domain-containing protein [Oligosphaeraceae bacterium]